MNGTPYVQGGAKCLKLFQNFRINIDSRRRLAPIIVMKILPTTFHFTYPTSDCLKSISIFSKLLLKSVIDFRRSVILLLVPHE
jgi:hypothetical protein